MPPKKYDRTPVCFSMLALPFSILLSATVLSFSTILTLATMSAARHTADSGRKTARRAHLRLATNRGRVLIATIPKV